MSGSVAIEYRWSWADDLKHMVGILGPISPLDRVIGRWGGWGLRSRSEEATARVRRAKSYRFMRRSKQWRIAQPAPPLSCDCYARNSSDLHHGETFDGKSARTRTTVACVVCGKMNLMCCRPSHA